MGVFEGAFPQWAYLVGYNTVSALLWLSILAWSALTATTAGPADVYPTVRVLLLSAQSLAALEILHALIGALAQPALPHPQPALCSPLTPPPGLVRAPVLTTFVQVCGRLTVLWIVVEAYPAAARTPFSGAIMVLAWAAADAVRYLYFAARLVGGHQYRNLTWLRYSAFYVLYPAGFLGEFGVVYAAVSEAWAAGYQGHAWGYVAAATLYLPGE